MKRFIILVAVFIVMATSIYAERDLSYLKTNNALNGRIFDEDPKVAEAYTWGCIDGLAADGYISKAYPNSTVGEIVATVKKFYTDNPAQKYRPIIKVLANACTLDNLLKDDIYERK